MIIFDLDGTLADFEHRRHFVDPDKDHEINSKGYNTRTAEKFVPDWKSFYEACDKDVPIEPVCDMLRTLSVNNEIQIWSGRCESVRIETHVWLMKYAGMEADIDNVKMRPIGDYTPDNQLKERWLDEYFIESYPELVPINGTLPGIQYRRNDPIQFVFDSDPMSIEMWRRRGIFVFNCCQHHGEF